MYHRLMMGFMIVSAFLSMWISNTATTAMMLPIAEAILQQLKSIEIQADERDLQAEAEANHGFEMEPRPAKQEIGNDKQPDTNTQQEDRVCK